MWVYRIAIGTRMHGLHTLDRTAKHLGADGNDFLGTQRLVGLLAPRLGILPGWQLYLLPAVGLGVHDEQVIITNIESVNLCLGIQRRVAFIC